MGANYYTKAIIGCQIDPDTLWDIEKSRLCDHSIPEGAKFCPECGKENKTIVRYIPRYHTEDTKGSPLSDYAHDEFKRWEGKAYSFCIDNVHVISGNLDVDAFAGLVCCESEYDQDSAFSTIQLADIKAETQKALDPLGFWDESKFGLYAILNVSV